MVLLRCDTPAPRAASRDFGMLRRGEIRVHLDQSAIAPKALELRRALALQQLTHLRNIKSVALEGNALRVSIGIGFRVPRVNWRGFSTRPPSPAELVWPRTPRRVSSDAHDSARVPHLEIGITKWRIRLPEVANGTRPARFISRSSTSRTRPPAHSSHASNRTTDISGTLGAALPGYGGTTAFRGFCRT
jgi:hypothetical protein